MLLRDQVLLNSKAYPLDPVLACAVLDKMIQIASEVQHRVLEGQYRELLGSHHSVALKSDRA
jgi:hypothetical protein